MRTKVAGGMIAGVAMGLLLSAVPAQAAVITVFENPVIRADVASYMVFDDGRPPIIVADSHDAGAEFGPSNPAPAVWNESVHSQAEARADDLFHSTSGSARMDRTWVTPSLLTINGQASAAWDTNVPTEQSPGTRAYPQGTVSAHLMLIFEVITETQLTLDYALSCCRTEFTLYEGTTQTADSILINAFAQESVPPTPTTGTFSQLLLPDRYLLLLDSGAILGDWIGPGSLSSSFDLRFVFESEPTTVPEPGTAALLAIGLVGLMLRRKARQQL